MLTSSASSMTETQASQLQHRAERWVRGTLTIQALQAQIEWFKRQIFGSKSERFAPEPDAQQMHLGQLLGEELPTAAAPEATSEVPAHERRKPRRDFSDDSASAPFFDRSKVPVHTIEVPNPEVQGLQPDQYEVIGQKVVYDDCDPKAFQEAIRPFHRNQWHSDAVARLFAEIANDKTPGHKTDTFQKIMGRPGRSLREYLATVA
jgi:hypothetical protein